MRVVRLLREDWEIVAVRDHRGICQVYRFLDTDVEEKLRKKMATVLRRAAFEGPRFRNEYMVSHLRGAIWQFKRGSRRGSNFRILFFSDNGLKRIVCTTAFLKKDKTPQKPIDDGQDIKDEYEKVKDTRNFEIVSIEDYLDEQA